MPTADDLKRNPFDIALTCVAAVLALGLAGFPVIGSRFALIYADFGGEIPLATRLAISAWVPLMVAAGIAATTVGAWIVGKPSPSRGALVIAVCAALLAYALLWTALYLPIFELAGKIRE